MRRIMNSSYPTHFSPWQRISDKAEWGKLVKVHDDGTVDPVPVLGNFRGLVERNWISCSELIVMYSISMAANDAVASSQMQSDLILYLKLCFGRSLVLFSMVSETCLGNFGWYFKTASILCSLSSKEIIIHPGVYEI